MLYNVYMVLYTCITKFHMWLERTLSPYYPPSIYVYFTYAKVAYNTLVVYDVIAYRYYLTIIIMAFTAFFLHSLKFTMNKLEKNFLWL